MNIDTIFESFKGLRVLIIGDVMVDKYIFGKVDRVSPEAPVPVVDVSKLDARLGGAGNVALNIKAMGAIPVLCTTIGNDPEAEDLMQMLENEKLSSTAIVQSDKRKTTTKTRVIGNNVQLIRIDHENASDLDTMDSYLLLQHFQRELETADVVIMEDYNKGVLHKDNIAVLLDLAQKNNVPVVVDPKKANFLSYQGATLFKPNLKEIKEGLNIDFELNNSDEIKQVVQQLQAELNNEISLVTLSEKGVYINGKGEEHYIPAHLRNIADVSGAGDTVVAVASLCLALKTPLALLAELSNLAGGLVCEQTGVVPINKKQLWEEARSLIK